MKREDFSGDKKEVIKNITEMFREKAINVISTSISEDIAMDKLKEDFIDKNAVSSALGPSFVFIKFYFKEGFKGDIVFLLPKSTVAQIADKMMMGEGDAEFDEEEHVEAIQELTDQILGAVSTELSGTFEFPISFSSTEARVMVFRDLENMTSELDIMSQFTITILDNAEVFLLTFESTFDNIIEILEEHSTESSEDGEEVLEMTTIGANMTGDVSVGKDLGLLMDVRLPVSVELGRKKMFIRDILKLSPGQVVELPKLQGEPVDLFVNGKKFADGEVVVVAENFGIRIKTLLSSADRLKAKDAWEIENSEVKMQN